MSDRKLSVSLRRITPKDAERYLQTSERNRTLNRARVLRYARDMKLGRWSAATMLIIDEDGHMVDGHHRMSAVVEAGVPAEMCVLTGLPKQAVPYIDTGRPRSAGDMLAFVEGLDGVASLRNKSVLARIVLKIRSGNFSTLPGYDDIADFMLSNKETVNEAYSFYSELKPLGGSLGTGAAAFIILDKVGLKNAVFQEFREQVASGEMIKSGMPTYALRNALFANGKTGSGGTRQVDDVYFVLKAWRGFVNGEAIQFLRRQKVVQMSDLAI